MNSLFLFTPKEGIVNEVQTASAAPSAAEMAARIAPPAARRGDQVCARPEGQEALRPLRKEAAVTSLGAFGYQGDWPDSTQRRAAYARCLEKLERLAYAPENEIRLVPNRLEAKALLAVMSETMST